MSSSFAFFAFRSFNRSYRWALLLAVPTASAQSLPETLPELKWHLTARPWTPVDQPADDLLDKVEDIVRAMAVYQDSGTGAIIDPYKAQEWQYSTPYFAFAAATVLSEGRAPELITQGALAMDRATQEVASNTVPQSHGEFVSAPIMKGLVLFRSMQQAGKFPAELTAARIATWENRMSTPRTSFMREAYDINWLTYASKGEWLRHKDGRITQGVDWIEAKWNEKQRSRFRRDRDEYEASPYFDIYHDDTCDPETFAYSGAAAGNYLDLLENGYTGASADDMREVIERSVTSDLLFMGASGEAPAGGRSGAHTWNDVVYGNAFEMMAEVAWRKGDLRSAGQFRRAAALAFGSAWRFQSEDGWFSVTKNHFHPSLGVNYAGYSALTNYNGYMEIHTSEAFASRKSEIPEQPVPAEIGGYCVQLDPEYDNVFINAGGMQVQICTRGTVTDEWVTRWHKLGIPRFSRVGWDSRLGPSDGFATWDLSQGISFAPTFLEDGVWKNLCTMPDRFEGNFTPELVSPLLIRGVLRFQPVSGQSGPSFEMKLTLTPSGALVETTRTSGTQEFGVSCPVLEYDGRTRLVTSVGDGVASTSFPYQNGSFQSYQAESAVLSGGVLSESDHAGFKGTGYANLPATGGEVRWENVEGGAGGPTVIGFRYALGNAARTVNLTVNGVTQTLTFDSTSSFADWHSVELPVTLLAGATNEIRVASIGQDGANLDELRVIPASANPLEMDEQNFIAFGEDHQLDASAAVIRSGYGDLRPVRMSRSGEGPILTYIYPRSAGEPTAAAVRDSYVVEEDGFATVLGRVTGNQFFNGTMAGGEGEAIDLDDDGVEDVHFSAPCHFVLRREGAQVVTVEVDQFVTMTHGGKEVRLAPYTPVNWLETASLWQHLEVPAVENRFEVQVDFTPETTAVDLPVGWAADGVTDEGALVAGVKWAEHGKIVPLAGSSRVDLSYEAGVVYRLRALFDLQAHRYSLWVKPEGEPERRLIVQAELPASVTSVDDLDTLAWLGSASLASHVEVTNYPVIIEPGVMDIKVNFQDAASAGYPGYEVDSGAAYGVRGSGRSYGWIEGANLLYRNRNLSQSPDERYDTLNQMQYNSPATETHTWEIGVPNGVYQVHLVCGDPGYTDSSYHVLAEGETLVRGVPSSSRYFVENTELVTVEDGRMTLTNGAGAIRNKICFIELGLVAGITDTFPYRDYASWAQDHFENATNEAGALPDADPNHDGLSNLMAYASSQDPIGEDAEPVTQFAWEEPASAEFRFLHSAQALDVSYQVWRTRDLKTWKLLWSSDEDADFTSSLVARDPSDANDWVTLTVPDDDGAAFFRLAVELP
ncbi:hypothetical protein HNR46_000283 [Haloferula luteola]|uniref:CBM6 domain-containing protein n=1 Tax=Haloferula luteola TaxID=595692 RepID=A0A840UW99_9BACT|nr:carbohydrate-binding protein [Haloferula luteola]MBB5350062.1 hypothetical protein [Haloferula luteola]